MTTALVRLLSRWARRSSGSTTVSTWTWVSIPGGPSARVTQSMAGPPGMRRPSTAPAISAVTRSLLLGLTTSMRPLMGCVRSCAQPLRLGAQGRCLRPEEAAIARPGEDPLAIEDPVAPEIGGSDAQAHRQAMIGAPGRALAVLARLVHLKAPT